MSRARARSPGRKARAKRAARLPLGVKDDASCDAFCRAARGKLGPPWALVNAAGVLTLGACEDFSLDELRDVMETNFFGGVRMTQRVLPDMRAAHEGRIVNFSSINGLLGIPFQGAYVASKTRHRGLLRMSRRRGAALRRLRHARRARRSSRRKPALPPARRRRPVCRLPLCGRIRPDPVATIARDEGHGSDPQALGRKVVRALSRKRMPFRLRVASLDQHFAVVIHDILPSRLYAHILRTYYYK